MRRSFKERKTYVFGVVFLNFQRYLIYQADHDRAVSKRLANTVGDCTFHNESDGFFYLRHRRLGRSTKDKLFCFFAGSVWGVPHFYSFPTVHVRLWMLLLLQYRSCRNCKVYTLFPFNCFCRSLEPSWEQWSMCALSVLSFFSFLTKELHRSIASAFHS